jgi:hypothetical protein
LTRVVKTENEDAWSALLLVRSLVSVEVSVDVSVAVSVEGTLRSRELRSSAVCCSASTFFASAESTACFEDETVPIVSSA